MSGRRGSVNPNRGSTNKPSASGPVPLYAEQSGGSGSGTALQVYVCPNSDPVRLVTIITGSRPQDEHSPGDIRKIKRRRQCSNQGSNFSPLASKRIFPGAIGLATSPFAGENGLEVLDPPFFARPDTGEIKPFFSLSPRGCTLSLPRLSPPPPRPRPPPHEYSGLVPSCPLPSIERLFR